MLCTWSPCSYLEPLFTRSRVCVCVCACMRCNQGTFVKFQPQSVDFLEISNPRAVLETTMRHFSCLTEGDVICLPYNDRVRQFF